MRSTGTPSRLNSQTAGAQPAKRRQLANFLIGHLMCTAQKATRFKVQLASHAVWARSPMVVPMQPVQSALYAAHPCCLRVSENLLLSPFLDAPCRWMYMQAGEFAERTGETCTRCPEGEYRGENDLPGDRCYACAAGLFAAGNGSKLCTECSKGQYQRGAGKSTCEECEPGLYQDQKGRTACEDCPLGTYCQNSTNHNFIPCPNGTTTREEKYGCKSPLSRHPYIHDMKQVQTSHRLPVQAKLFCGVA